MSTRIFSEDIDDTSLERMASVAAQASSFLKAIGHDGRLMILCHLADGEKSVTQLEELLSARQAAVSQQLSRLRLEGLIESRREGKSIYYHLTDNRAKRVMDLVYDLFCGEQG
ncbi:metalloregulator ArsR/SmtB family transcription factor [uncultured Cohaesibacter sp.]|uniref:ArsR/SmtB family transcription factor n=1 Tax=uncultured Cohaesibacter sp. TaxID=1002546 RepID=UPI0029C6F299|nr:metalloregulator ArsR/SmtB family transcription factor [uncultured Cohaesibacter sp.]